MLLLSILIQILGAIPLAEQTIAGFRDLLSKDPNVPADLQAILTSGDTDDMAVISRATAWLAAHPE